MKKFILIFLIMCFAISSYGFFGWDNSSGKYIAVWEFENNAVDVINGYAMTNNNTGGGYQTTNPSSYMGNYSYFTSTTQNYKFIPTAPQTALKNSAKWTIEWRGWFPTKNLSVLAGYSDCMYFSRGNGADGGAIFLRLTTNAWNPWSQNGQFYIGADAWVGIGAFSTTTYTNGTANAWNRITICYDGSYYRLFFNGNLTYTSNAGKPNLFAITSANTTFRTSSEWGNDYGGYLCKGMDNLIFYADDTNGADILNPVYIADGVYYSKHLIYDKVNY